MLMEEMGDTKMKYRRLSFGSYFIICSQNYNKRLTNLNLAEYEEIEYRHGRHTHRVNFQVRYEAHRQCIQIIFQQTADRSDWRANLEFPEKLYDAFTFEGRKIQMRVHGGWGDMWKACRDAVRAKTAGLLGEHPDAYIEVIGWSLGSALAQICAEDVYYRFGIKPYLYTYGSVKPFMGRRTYMYVRRCCEKAYNFYDHCDIVGYMVPFGWCRAINHVKVKSERFCIAKLFNPRKFHTLYDDNSLYEGIE